MSRVKDLIVDSGAFLRNSPLQDYGENIYTCEEVLGEIKSKWAKERLQVLPYEIKVKEPEDEDLQFVIRFARKTGDLFSLSNTDLKVIALAVRLEREKNGNIDHLKSVPTSTKIVSNLPSKPSNVDVYGFNFKNKLDKSTADEKVSNELENNEQLEVSRTKSESNQTESEGDQTKSEVNQTELKPNKTESNDDEKYYELSDECSEDENFNSCEENDEESNADFNDYYTDLIKCKGKLENENSDEDHGDWITPSNIDMVKKQFDSLKLDEKKIKIEINTACITGDFSMQNVLMQIGIKVLSVQKGLLIKQSRQFVLRCIACFTITNNTSLMFCPSCGNLKTLKKVSVSVDQNGEKRIHLNPKRPITTRDLKLRIPRPRKGKYALNPILVADQHVPKFRQAKFAIQERKLVNDSVLSDVGYLVRDNPFSINDVYSRSSNYKTGSRAAAINSMVFNEGRKYANKRKKKRRN